MQDSLPGESTAIVDGFLALVLTDVLAGLGARRGGPWRSTLPFANFRRPKSRDELELGGTPMMEGVLDAMRAPGKGCRDNVSM